MKSQSIAYISMEVNIYIGFCTLKMTTSNLQECKDNFTFQSQAEQARHGLHPGNEGRF